MGSYRRFKRYLRTTAARTCAHRGAAKAVCGAGGGGITARESTGPLWPRNSAHVRSSVRCHAATVLCPPTLLKPPSPPPSIIDNFVEIRISNSIIISVITVQLFTFLRGKGSPALLAFAELLVLLLLPGTRHRMRVWGRPTRSASLSLPLYMQTPRSTAGRITKNTYQDR